MKNHTALYGSAAALVAGGLMLAWSSTGNRPVSSSAIPTPPPSAQETAEAPDSKPSDALAQAGTLWEPEADTPREAERSSIQVAAEPLKAALTSPPGSRLQLALSPKFTPLDATVTASHVQEDGTVVTFLRISGEPAGTLTLQENTEFGFFLGQLYYDGGYPIAYEFRKSGNDIKATRHAVSELICSELDQNKQQVVMAGLPPARQTATPKPASVKRAPAQTKGLKIAVSDVIANETDGDIIYMTFTARLSKANKKKAITVDYTTIDGTAVANADYHGVSGTITFPPKSTIQTITVPIPCDDVAEANKSFTLNLSNPVNATLVNSTATGTIIDDDATPEFSVSDVLINEGDKGNKEVRIPVTLKQAYVSPVRVFCSTVDGTAIAGVDYAKTSGTLVFNPGETSKMLATTIRGDFLSEGDESFSIELSNAEGMITDSQGAVTILDNDASNFNVPDLNSLPEARAVIYLDMDGQVVTGTPWNQLIGGGPIDARGVQTFLNPIEMKEIWQRVAEDFSPFQVNVTTNEAVYLAATPTRRIRCIITPDSKWYGSAGGVAYLGSFTWPGDTPCWVFADQLGYLPDLIAEAVSHEAGHTLGLEHDGRISPSEEYYGGHGTGETSWAPIMGVGYYSNLVQWSKGEYASANNTEDDLSIITSLNGFDYRTDDVGDSNLTAVAMQTDGISRSANGIIETRDDVDIFTFTTTGGAVSFTISGDSASQNLDIAVMLTDANGQTSASSSPDTLTDASISTSLPAGTYYLHVFGVGRGSALSSGYSDYGSLGQYKILGVAP